jgi:hypothetical protein
MDDFKAWSENAERTLKELMQDTLRLQEDCARSRAEAGKSPEAKQWQAFMEKYRIRKVDPPLWRDVT